MTGADATQEVAAQEPRQHQIADQIREAADATGVAFEFLLAQANQESQLNPEARSNRSSAMGLFQFTSPTWLDMIKAHGAEHGLKKYADAIAVDNDGNAVVADKTLRKEILELRRDARVSALMAGEYAKDNQKILESRLGRPASSHDLYLAHFLGAGGAVRVLRNGDHIAAEKLPTAAAANPEFFQDPVSQSPRSTSGLVKAVSARFDSAMSEMTPVARKVRPAIDLAELRPAARPDEATATEAQTAEFTGITGSSPRLVAAIADRPVVRPQSGLVATAENVGMAGAATDVASSIPISTIVTTEAGRGVTGSLLVAVTTTPSPPSQINPQDSTVGARRPEARPQDETSAIAGIASASETAAMATPEQMIGSLLGDTPDFAGDQIGSALLAALNDTVASRRRYQPADDLGTIRPAARPEPMDDRPQVAEDTVQSMVAQSIDPIPKETSASGTTMINAVVTEADSSDVRGGERLVATLPPPLIQSAAYSTASDSNEDSSLTANQAVATMGRFPVRLPPPLPGMTIDGGTMRGIIEAQDKKV